MADEKPLAQMTKAELLAHAEMLEAQVAALAAGLADASAALPAPSGPLRQVWINGTEYSWRPGDEASVPPEAVLIYQRGQGMGV